MKTETMKFALAADGSFLSNYLAGQLVYTTIEDMELELVGQVFSLFEENGQKAKTVKIEKARKEPSASISLDVEVLGEIQFNLSKIRGWPKVRDTIIKERRLKNGVRIQGKTLNTYIKTEELLRRFRR